MFGGLETHTTSFKGRPCLRSSIIHLQEAHRKELIDFGREFDGEERIHDVEGTNETLFALLQPLEGEVHIVKRRYSGFFATDLNLLTARPRGFECQTSRFGVRYGGEDPIGVSKEN